MDENVKRVNKLINEIAKGRKKSLDKLFVEFGGMLFIMARKYLYDKTYAEDLVSDLLLKLVKSAATFKNGKNGLNWIFKSIKNAAININRRSSYFTMENIEDHFDICDVYNEEELLNAIDIKAALDNLDTIEKKIIQMKFWDGLTVREIAKELGKPLATTQRQIATILDKMKKRIQGQ